MDKARRFDGKRSTLVVVALVIAVAAVPAVAALLPQPPPLPVGLFTTQQVAGGLTQPIFITHAGDGSGNIYVVQQNGIVLRMDQDGGNRVTYLNVAGKIVCCGERGLLGLAFHPNFENNRLVYISYTGPGGTLTVEELLQPVAGFAANPAGQIIITQAHPRGNHNGGGIAFGPDGMLYIAWGDGGGGGDPDECGQNTNCLLGKMLRLNVDGAQPYSIPADNPFVGGGGRPEIWDYGLRNPWRWSFDRLTGDLYIADVGQNLWEEVNFEAAGTGGLNYGWDCYEGLHQFEFNGGCPNIEHHEPWAEYNHALGCSVTGGYVYRGAAVPILQGMYLYGDYCSGIIWIAPGQGATRVPIQAMDTSYQITSWGEDEDGEVYFTVYAGGAAGNGAIRRIAP